MSQRRISPDFFLELRTTSYVSVCCIWPKTLVLKHFNRNFSALKCLQWKPQLSDPDTKRHPQELNMEAILQGSCSKSPMMLGASPVWHILVMNSIRLISATPFAHSLLAKHLSLKQGNPTPREP